MAMLQMAYHWNCFLENLYHKEAALGTILRTAFFFIIYFLYIGHVVVMDVKPQYTSPDRSWMFTIMYYEEKL